MYLFMFFSTLIVFSILFLSACSIYLELSGTNAKRQADPIWQD
ncbi:outer membrane biogenesis lipoprotein LolB [Ensifer sp. KUDG1]